MLSLALAAALIAAAPQQVETSVALPSRPAPLYGTMLAPAGPPRAVAVILPGSGPTDRNGNSAAGNIAAQPYRLLAEGLVADGIATIRIDKRAIGESAPAAVSEAELRFNDYADDARAWAAEAARRAGLPCAWLIGHSEGSLVALAAVRAPDDHICGVVSLSGAGRPAGDVLRQQLANLPQALHDPAFDAIDELEAGRTVTGTPPELDSLFRPSVQPYVISWFALDPAAIAAGYDGPLLIVQGTTDLQVSVDDARALAAAQPRARLVLIDGMNHVLKVAPAERAANILTYRDPTLPLAPGVVEAVAGFILER